MSPDVVIDSLDALGHDGRRRMPVFRGGYAQVNGGVSHGGLVSERERFRCPADNAAAERLFAEDRCREVRALKE